MPDKPELADSVAGTTNGVSELTSGAVFELRPVFAGVFYNLPTYVLPVSAPGTMAGPGMPDTKRKTEPSDIRRTSEMAPADREQDLAKEVKRQTDQLEAINNVITAAIRSPNLRKTLQTALEAALSIIRLEASGISLIDEAAGELVMWAQLGWKHDFTSTPMRIKIGEGLSGLAVATGEVVITGDPAEDSRLVVPAFAKENIKAMALVPMRARGKVVGVLSVMSRSPYTFSDGEIATLRVIADQVGLALDNTQLYESVRAQQSRLEAVLNSTADAIIATADDGIINLVNLAAEVLFDIKAESIIGQPLREAPFLPAMREKLQKAMILDNGASPAEMDRTARVTLEEQTPQGRYILGFVSPVYSHTRLDDKPTDAWVAVFQDVTHLKLAEQARVQFIQMAAHELRNPLSVTLGALSMLNRNLQPGPADQEVFDIALRGLNRMQDLIDDLLDLERIETGADIRFEPVVIPALIKRVALDMQPVLARKGQKLDLVVQTPLPVFNGDERWLYRALVNLVTNAHKYTPEGSQVTLRAEARSNELVLQVEDDGPGIPRDVLPRLFDRFYRARRTEQKEKGTGLGLAIVKSVAEKHKGRVFARSELPMFSTLWTNRGSTFGMVMPFRDKPDS